MEITLKCSIGSKVNTDCGFSARYPLIKEVIPLLSCTRDVRVHLKKVKVSSSSVLSEAELILLRAGIFDKEGEGVTVCPKHRDSLGLSWRPSRLCKHPMHPEGKKLTCDRGVSKKTSVDVMRRWNTLLPIGSGKLILKYYLP